MTALFESPKTPQIPAAIVAPPTVDDKAVQQAALDERNRAALASGRKSTILTGGLGDQLDNAPGTSIYNKTLLGS